MCRFTHFFQVAEQAVLYVVEMFGFGQLQNRDESKSCIHKPHTHIQMYCILDLNFF